MRQHLTFSSKLVILISLTLTFLTSCKKEFPNQMTVPNEQAGITAFPLSWETIDYMPTPAGTTILVPWANGSVKTFPSEIWYDYKNIEGWELVYNTFNTTSLPSNPWFALYNRYRGLFRIYVYVNTNGFVNSSNLTVGLNLDPSVQNSSLLNFIAQDLVDANPTATKKFTSEIQNTQMATGAWYASQFEMAYDPGIATATFNNLGLNFYLTWSSVTTFNLAGNVQGGITGTIKTPASQFDFLGNAQSGALSALGSAIFSNNVGSDPNHPENGNKLGLPAQVFKAALEGLNGGLTGAVKNIMSGIFGGSAASTQEVNLTLNASISLTGGGTSPGGLFPLPGLGLGIPGISNSQSAIGYIPKYNKVLGVINLSGRPTVRRATRTAPGIVVNGVPYTRVITDYTVDQTVFNSLLLKNPDVINTSATGASIQNLRTEVLLFRPRTTNYFAGYGVSEILGSYTGYSGFTVTTTYDVEKVAMAPQNTFAGVRVIFDVVPNNGSKPSKIVKTFLANVQ